MARKTLLAAGIAGLTVSSAFAAGFDLNGAAPLLADVSSGTVTVDDCSSGLELDVMTGDYLPDADTWAVTGVRVTGTAGTIPATCAGFGLVGQLDAATGTVMTDALDLAGGETEVVLPVAQDSAITAADITDASLLLDQPGLAGAPPVAGGTDGPLDAATFFAGVAPLNSGSSGGSSQNGTIRSYAWLSAFTTGNADDLGYFEGACSPRSVYWGRVTRDFPWDDNPLWSNPTFTARALIPLGQGGQTQVLAPSQYVLVDAAGNLVKTSTAGQFDGPLRADDPVHLGVLSCSDGSEQGVIQLYVESSRPS